MEQKDKQLLIKQVALFAIYLIVSLIFITAKAMAVLNYDIRGGDDVSGYARSQDDVVTINTTSNGNVSFVLANSEELPLECSNIGSSNELSCEYAFAASDIALSSDVHDISFTLKQDSGTPAARKGQLYIDGAAPRADYFTATPNGTGILFKYSFTDYYSDSQTMPENPSGCTASGIGSIELNVQGRNVLSQTISTHNCTVAGEYFASLANTYNDRITYEMNVEDRLGNTYATGLRDDISGDFKAPVIGPDYKIISESTGMELSTLSSSAKIDADIVVNIEDENLDVNSVYADLSSLNINPAMSKSPSYTNAQGTCVKDSTDATDIGYTCTFGNIEVRPASSVLAITVTASDSSSNTATKSITKNIGLVDDAGSVSYIGPLKDHCSSDLSQCYAKPGMQIVQIILDSSSSFNATYLNIGVDSSRAMALCFLNDTLRGTGTNRVWICNGAYSMPSSGTASLFLASDSYDDYGNALVSSIERTVTIDNTPPALIGTVNAVNSNNNDCSVNGDNLDMTFKIHEASSSELKVYMNTTTFTTEDLQKGSCVLAESGTSDEWDCSISISNFISTPITANTNLMVEDLAGNILSIPQNISVCKSSSTSAPNVVGTFHQVAIPNIDRRTASKISVQAYVPLTIDVKSGSAIMYLSVDRCTAQGETGLDVMGSGSYFTPNYGSKPMLVLSIGHSGAQLANDSFDVNCTISMRVRSGNTVFTKEQSKNIILHVSTYNNPLGTLDSATLEEIKAVKLHIRDTDSTIKKYQMWDNTLGKLCNIAETIGKINSIAQAIKSVVYGICLVLKVIPVTSAYADKIWKAINTPLSGLHKIVDTFIWPPGTLPTLSVGSAVKTVCMVYTCKHLDIGTYTGMMTDLATTGAVDVLKTSKQGVMVSKNMIDTSGQIDNLNNGDYTSDANREQRAVLGEKYNALVNIQKDNVMHTNDMLIDSLNGHQWIVNPYKSIHYDDTCMPAILYNTQKDRQINCMYLRCLNEQLKTGLPKIVCDGSYKMNKCLYLDSAEYLLHGQQTLGVFMSGLGDAFKNALPGLGIETTYLIACKNYYTQGNDLVKGWRSVACGLAGSVMSMKEILSTFSNPFFSSKPALPSTDYCAGLDYSDTSYVDTGESSA